MKTVTVNQFLKFEPCYSEEKIRKIAGNKKKWSALDILKLTGVPAKDKLWAVLRIELIDEDILHEFACLCAENALKLIKNPDERIINAIKAKRAWLNGEITDEELAAANAAARAANAAARAAYAAADAVADAAYSAANAAADAAYYAAYAAADATYDESQVKMLIELLGGE